MKSNASAAMTTAQTKRKWVSTAGKGSGVFQDHAFDDVGDVLATIGGRLEQLVQLFPLDDRDRILFLAEQPRNGTAKHGIRFVLEAVDLDALFQNDVGVLEVAQARDRLEHAL